MDHMAQGVIERVFGQRRVQAQPALSLAPIERYLQFQSLNDTGWGRIIQRVGPDGARAYRDAMVALGRELGLD